MAADVKKTAKVSKVTKKATEVKTLEQLQEELVTIQAEHLESRKSHRAGELVNPHVLTVQRKNIARAHTAIAIAKGTAVKEEN
ncbi:MAG: 50S ribosomal protein L29 [Candidatus Microsaccharimonas sp.]